METKGDTFAKVFRYIRFHSLIYGIILLVFGCIGFYFIYFSITNSDNPYFINILIFQLIFIIPFIVAGLLLIVTYFGLSRSKIYAKITGILGCGSILIPLIITLPSAYISSEYFWPSIIVMLILYVPSVVLIVLIAVFWGKIPSYNKIQVTKKAKKVIAGITVVVVLVAVLFIVIPDIQKHLALDSLKYADYENGWGFNPPADWQIDDKYYPIFTPPVEDNMSDQVYLFILVGTTSSNIDKIAQQQLEEFQGESSWINHTVNFSIISHGKKRINGMDSSEVVFSFKSLYDNTVGPEITIKRIMVLKGNKVLSINYQSLSIYYDKYESDIDQSLSSLTIV